MCDFEHKKVEGSSLLGCYMVFGKYLPVFCKNVAFKMLATLLSVDVRAWCLQQHCLRTVSHMSHLFVPQYCILMLVQEHSGITFLSIFLLCEIATCSYLSCLLENLLPFRNLVPSSIPYLSRQLSEILLLTYINSLCLLGTRRLSLGKNSGYKS